MRRRGPIDVDRGRSFVQLGKLPFFLFTGPYRRGSFDAELSDLALGSLDQDDSVIKTCALVAPGTRAAKEGKVTR